MRSAIRAAVCLVLISAPLAAQNRSVTISGDTSAEHQSCSATEAIAAIVGWFDAFSAADARGLARHTASENFVFSIGMFAPKDTFVRIQRIDSLIAYAKARQQVHEHSTLQAIEFYGWRAEDRLGFLPRYLRRADDLGPSPIAGVGKAEYRCGQGISVLNLAPDPFRTRSGGVY